MEKILVIEDDVSIARLLTFNLEKEGYNVITALDGLEGLNLARSQRPDFILLDLMLPTMDGMEICKTLRMEKINNPILILTAKDDIFDKILSLEIGADDYVTKPFNLREVMARVKAILRRTRQSANSLAELSSETVFTVGPLTLFMEGYEALLRDRKIELTRREFELLHFLAKHEGKVLTRDQLMNEIWSYEYSGDSRIVDVHVSHLREKLEKDVIKTVRGKGYKFEISIFN
jgi:two-component system, OmpR family, alkaline phosphatase synthesis response regulator PhoP